MSTNEGNLTLKTALQAGRIMIENGSEVSRVEDTITRIAYNAGYPSSKVYVTITGIMMSISERGEAQIEPILKRTLDLDKIAIVNDLSRKFAAKEIDLTTFSEQLDYLEKHAISFPLGLQAISAALVSGTLEVVFRDNLHDFWITSLVGMIGWLVYYGINQLVKVRFISEFLGSVMIGLLAILAVNLHLGLSMDDIIIGSVMPLVPGVPLTNAVRDILAGDLVSGIARGVEALMSAIAIGSGIAMMLQIL